MMKEYLSNGEAALLGQIRKPAPSLNELEGISEMKSPAIKYGVRPSRDAKSSGHYEGLVPQLGTGFSFT